MGEPCDEGSYAAAFKRLCNLSLIAFGVPA